MDAVPGGILGDLVAVWACERFLQVDKIAALFHGQLGQAAVDLLNTGIVQPGLDAHHIGGHGGDRLHIIDHALGQGLLKHIDHGAVVGYKAVIIAHADKAVGAQQHIHIVGLAGHQCIQCHLLCAVCAGEGHFIHDRIGANALIGAVMRIGQARGIQLKALGEAVAHKGGGVKIRKLHRRNSRQGVHAPIGRIVGGIQRLRHRCAHIPRAFVYRLRRGRLLLCLTLGGLALGRRTFRGRGGNASPQIHRRTGSPQQAHRDQRRQAHAQLGAARTAVTGNFVGTHDFFCHTCFPRNIARGGITAPRKVSFRAPFARIIYSNIIGCFAPPCKAFCAVLGLYS